MGFQAQPWAHCLVPASLGVGKPEGQGGFAGPKKPLLMSRSWRFVLSQWLRNFRDSSHIFSLFSTHPSRASVLLCAEYIWVVALDIPVLQPGFNCACAKLFVGACYKKQRCPFLFHVCTLEKQLFRATLFISSEFNDIIFHVIQEFYWFAVQLFAGLY